MTERTYYTASQHKSTGSTVRAYLKRTITKFRILIHIVHANLFAIYSGLAHVSLLFDLISYVMNATS